MLRTCVHCFSLHLCLPVGCVCPLGLVCLLGCVCLLDFVCLLGCVCPFGFVCLWGCVLNCVCPLGHVCLLGCVCPLGFVCLLGCVCPLGYLCTFNLTGAASAIYAVSTTTAISLCYGLTIANFAVTHYIFGLIESRQCNIPGERGLW